MDPCDGCMAGACSGPLPVSIGAQPPCSLENLGRMFAALAHRLHSGLDAVLDWALVSQPRPLQTVSGLWPPSLYHWTVLLCGKPRSGPAIVFCLPCRLPPQLIPTHNLAQNAFGIVSTDKEAFVAALRAGKVTPVLGEQPNMPLMFIPTGSCQIACIINSHYHAFFRATAMSSASCVALSSASP